MVEEIRPNYDQLLLLPPSIEDWVPADHPARFIRDFVGCLDLEGLGFRLPDLLEGRPPYAVDLLLSVWLYGYMQKIRSTRGLERACREQMGLIWLTGNRPPDHNTLWRFWRENRSALRGVFGRVVRVAHQAGLVDLVLHAVDGTKVCASVSQRGTWRKQDLERLLAGLDAAIDEVMAEVESAQGGEGGSYRLPQKLLDATKRREEIRRALAELDASGRKQVHATDRDARVMRGSDGLGFGYNAQAVVDDGVGLLVAADVFTAERDSELLVPMIGEVQEHLGEAAAETVADGGYYSSSQLAEAEVQGLGVLVKIPRQELGERKRGKIPRSEFAYDEKRDLYVCPAGHDLRLRNTRLSSGKKYLQRVYQCTLGSGCCCRTGKGPRQVHRAAYDDAMKRQREKQQIPGKKVLLAQRAALVERSFALIKEHMGFRRFTVRGLAKVQTQWALVCTAFNLRVLYARWRVGRLALP